MQKPTSSRTSLGRRLLAGAKEMLAHARGEIQLETYSLPDSSEFHRELANRLAALDRGEFADPAEVHARLRRKSQERRESGV